MTDRAVFTLIEGVAVIAVAGVMMATVAAWFAYQLVAGRGLNDSDAR